jgi:hypothetical protein
MRIGLPICSWFDETGFPETCREPATRTAAPCGNIPTDPVLRTKPPRGYRSSPRNLFGQSTLVSSGFGPFSAKRLRPTSCSSAPAPRSASVFPSFVGWRGALNAGVGLSETLSKV